jgi:hypothetical protein
LNKSARSKKIVSAFLAAALFSNSAFAYLPENNYWTERRKAVQRVASLPQSLPPIASAVMDRLPRATDSSRSISSTVPALRTFIESIPSSQGTVRRVELPRGKIEGAVLHIQDVHQNAEAQTNISKTVQLLM